MAWWGSGSIRGVGSHRSQPGPRALRPVLPARTMRTCSHHCLGGLRYEGRVGSDAMAAPNQPFVGHIVLDVPAENPTLRFDQIAHALATIVQTSPPRFAIGVFGGWGSGKSTLMDEIQRLLVGRGTIVVQFNAWRYEREPHLIVPLLDTIRAGLAAWANRHGAGANAEKIRAIARRVGRVVRALVRATSVDIGVPGAVSISVDPGKAL